MIQSKELAKLIGPTLSVMSITEMINLKIWENNIPPLTYLNGILLFIAGVSIIRVHNLWVLAWPLLLTLIGWISIIGGSFRIFFPEAKQAGDAPFTYIILIILLLTGLYLTYKAYEKT